MALNSPLKLWEVILERVFQPQNSGEVQLRLTDSKIYWSFATLERLTSARLTLLPFFQCQEMKKYQ